MTKESSKICAESSTSGSESSTCSEIPSTQDDIICDQSGSNTESIQISNKAKQIRLDGLIDNDKDKEYFKQRLHKIVKDGKHESSFFAVVEQGSELFIQCDPCDKLVATGARHRALGSFSRHLETPTHKNKCSMKLDKMAKKQMNDREEKSKLEQKIHLEKEKKLVTEALQKKADNIKVKYGDCFTLLISSTSLMCNYCMKKVSLQGPYEHNVSEHVKSSDHMRNKGREKPQSSMKSFLKPL